MQWNKVPYMACVAFPFSSLAPPPGRRDRPTLPAPVTRVNRSTMMSSCVVRGLSVTVIYKRSWIPRWLSRRKRP